MRPHILAESTGARHPWAYIESSLAFMREHRNNLIAIVEIGQRGGLTRTHPMRPARRSFAGID